MGLTTVISGACRLQPATCSATSFSWWCQVPLAQLIQPASAGLLDLPAFRHSPGFQDPYPCTAHPEAGSKAGWKMGVARIPLAHQLKLVADNMPAEAGKNRGHGRGAFSFVGFTAGPAEIQRTHWSTSNTRAQHWRATMSPTQLAFARCQHRSLRLQSIGRSASTATAHPLPGSVAAG